MCGEWRISENCCGILNCDIYHLFWIEGLHDLLLQLDDLLEIRCMTVYINKL